MAVWNLLARLSMDSEAFDRNAKKSRRSLYSMQKQSEATRRGLMRMAKAGLAMAGLGGGLYGLARAFRSVTDAAMVQESAERKLRAALSASGDALEGHFDRLKDYASAIQQATIYGDEEVLAQMAYARNLGITAEQLGTVTQGAIGLATALDMDLSTAMRYTAVAMQGEFTMLRRYLPELRQTESATEQLAIVNRKMAAGWAQARAESRDTAGSIQQMKNRIGDVKEVIGQDLLPAYQTAMEGIAEYLEGNQEQIATWASNAVEAAATVVEAMGKAAGFVATMKREIAGGDSELKYWRTLRKEMDKSADARYRFQMQQMGRDPYSAPFAGPGPVLKTDPKLYEKIRRQVESEFMATRAREAKEADRVGPIRTPADEIRALNDQAQPNSLGQLGALPAMGGDGAAAIGPSLTPIDYEAYHKQLMDSFDGAAKDSAAERARVWRVMASDMDQTSRESWDVRRRLLTQERDEYTEVMGQKSEILKKWYAQQRRDLRIDEQIAGGGLGEGFAAGLQRMQLELTTLGQLGADLGQTLRDGLVDSIGDAVFEARDLGEALQGVARQMARMAFDWVMQRTVTSGMNALFPSFHGGGLVGSTAGAPRAVDPGLFSGARRYHDGLSSDEFPAILQTGERVTPRGGGSDSRVADLLGQIVGRLDALANRPGIVVDPRHHLSADEVPAVIADYTSRGGQLSLGSR